MASNKTTNYDLPQWEKDDFIQMDEFNDLTSKLDAALKANADAASQSVSAEQTARANAIAELTKNLGTAGHNARIALGSYAGTGAIGKNTPNSLSFDFYPVLVIIAPFTESTPCNPRIFIRGRNVASCQPEGGSNYTQEVTWSDTSVSWYSTSETTNSYLQMNHNSMTYCYVVLGYDKTAEGTT